MDVRRTCGWWGERRTRLIRGKNEPPVLSITGYFTQSVVRLGKVINRDVRDNVGQTRESRVARGGGTHFHQGAVASEGNVADPSKEIGWELIKRTKIGWYENY